MRHLGRTVLIVATSVPHATSALAHAPLPGAVGYYHVLSDMEHIPTFLFLGFAGAIFVRAFGGLWYISVMLAFFTMLMIHGHVFDRVEVGRYFALGFLGTGLITSIAAMNLVGSLMEHVGRRSRAPDQD